MKEKLYKIFHPKNFILVIGFLFILLSLFCLIYFDSFDSSISYILYLLMSYFFIVICIKIFSVLKNNINKFIDNNKYLKKYKEDHKLKYKISLFLSLGLNIFYVIFKLTSGIIYKSLWFISFAIYYIILVIVRVNIAEYEINKKTSLKEEYKKYRNTGIILLFMNVFLMIVILVIVNQHIVIQYNMIIAIGVACYTFYLLISSIINMIKYRKYKSPLMSSSKTINFIASLISMLSLEVIMLSTFGAEQIQFNEIMIMATGGGISLIIIIISLYMIIKSTEWINNSK